MSLDARSYSGKLFRPTPEIHQEEGGELYIIATPWGARSGAQKAIQVIQDFFLSARNDVEATSPFETLTCLSPIANNLRAAVMLANSTLYREENKNEYTTGIELLALARSEREWVWVQSGQPQILLIRPGQSLILLGHQQDAALEFSQKEWLPPLPPYLLGTTTNANFTIKSFRPQKNDSFLFISRSQIPAALLTQQQTSLDALSQTLANEDQDQPFWIGWLSLELNNSQTRLEEDELTQKKDDTYGT